MSDFENQARYSERHSVSRKTVTMWKNKGLLVLDNFGLIDIKKSDENLKKYRLGGLDMSPRFGQPAQPEEDPTAGNLEAGKADYNEAKRVKENYAALQEKLEFEVKSGKLIPIDEAKNIFFEEFKKMRDSWINWPMNIAPHLAAELNAPADKILTVLNEYVHNHLSDLGKPDPLGDR